MSPKKKYKPNSCKFFNGTPGLDLAGFKGMVIIRYTASCSWSWKKLDIDYDNI